jgi:hypothetical protein
MASKGGWSRRFDDPIPLPSGRQLVTLKDAAGYIMKLPKAEQNRERWQTAVRELMIAAERNGIMMLAQMAMLQALNHASHLQLRHRPRSAQRPTRSFGDRRRI